MKTWESQKKIWASYCFIVAKSLHRFHVTPLISEMYVPTVGLPSSNDQHSLRKVSQVKASERMKNSASKMYTAMFRSESHHTIHCCVKGGKTMQSEGSITPPNRDWKFLEEMVGTFAGGIPRQSPWRWLMHAVDDIDCFLAPATQSIYH